MTISLVRLAVLSPPFVLTALGPQTEVTALGGIATTHPSLAGNVLLGLPLAGSVAIGAALGGQEAMQPALMVSAIRLRITENIQ